jgi:protein-tyrosine phosphatase
VVIGLSAPLYTISAKADVAANSELDRSYRRLLPLEGGSNFRDRGGYLTETGQRVKRGLLFRSGAMVSFTDADKAYLAQFGFKSVVDLRSLEERELYPNTWVGGDSGVTLIAHDYKMKDMMGDMSGPNARKLASDMGHFYRRLPESLIPQLKLYFQTLLAGEVPAAVNCSAGQDRTGFTSALVLRTLGVPRQMVVEDYLLSTDFRRPTLERGNVDVKAAAENGNFFAKMMLAYSGQGKSDRPNPLITPDGVPLIEIALDAVDEKWGGPEGYLNLALGLTDSDIAKLRADFLE